ncbi:hypothetical protein Acr_27g0002680 [Actinidia rufa]|uniref:Tf2-1-like SH3-like domain-containing protein n=1 Tax=Actinidia rufa TaxID=165716 RepID=A0A7J0H663_9ERIC|nr:hypothetical protein Acr_27g0002680 [Actinidia rufa]
MELNRAQLLSRATETASRWYLADPPSWAPVSHHPDAEGDDGTLPPHLHAGLYQLCLNRAHNGYFDAQSGAPLQCRGPTSCLYCGAAEEGARHTLLKGPSSLTRRGCAPCPSSWLGGEHHIKEKEGEKVVSHLVLNRRRNWVLPTIEPQSSEHRAHSNLEFRHQAFRQPRLRPALPRRRVADSAKYHDTNLALAQAVMLSKDIADLAKEGSEEIMDLLRGTAISERMKEQSAEIKKSKKKISSLKKQVKLDSEAAEKAKLDLIIVVQERDASYAAITEARGESAAPPKVELVYPTQVYSPLVLLGFNEEELLEEAAYKVPEKTPKVASKLSQEAVEASAVAEDGLNADLSLDFLSCRVKFTIGSIQFNPNSVLIRMYSWVISKLGEEIKSIAMVYPVFPLKIDDKPTRKFSLRQYSNITPLGLFKTTLALASKLFLAPSTNISHAETQDNLALNSQLRHHPGKANVVVDTLSRKGPSKLAEVASLAIREWKMMGKIGEFGVDLVDCTGRATLYGLVVQPILVNQVNEAQSIDEEAEAIRAKLVMGEEQPRWVSPRRGLKRFGLGGKLSPRYIGPFDIIVKIGEVAYCLALPSQLSGVHDVFWKYLELEADVSYVERPIRILDTLEHVLRGRSIPMVKVLWTHHGNDEATWEKEDEVRAKSELFQN